MSKTGISEADIPWNPYAQLVAPLKRKKPSTYVVSVMSDLFQDRFTDTQIAAVFGVMAAAREHTFIVRTPRARRMREWFEWLDEEIEEEARASAGAACSTSIHDARTEERAFTLMHYAANELGDGSYSDQEGWYNALLRKINQQKLLWPLPNIILGVSVEDQATANERIPHLLATPAAVRAISAEPLLGPIDVARYMWPVHWNWDSKYATPQEALAAGARAEKCRQALVLAPAAFLNWVAAGCESGPNARPCEVSWLRSLRDQCVAAKVPFWLKQARVDCGCPWSHAHNDTEGCESCSCTWSPGDVGSVESGVVALTDAQVKSDPSNNRLGALVSLPYLDGVQWMQRPEVRR